MLTNNKLGTLSLLVALSGALACGDSDDKSAGDAGGQPAGDAGGNACELSVDPISSAESAGTGTVKGTIKLTEGAKAQGGWPAKGDLYVAIVETFDPGASCPGSAGAPQPVAQTLIHCADLTDGKSVDFEVHGITPRADTYYLVPFIDTNGNAMAPGAAGPDTCDLLSLAVEVKVTSAETVSANAELGVDGSILGSLCQLPACPAYEMN